MFLSSMRTGIFSGVFLGVLLLGGVGLILSDHGNFFQDGYGKTDVIVIGGQPIKTMEFDRIVKNTLQGQNISASDAYKAGYIDRIAQNEVVTRLFRKAAYDLGIIADDKTVAAQVQKSLAPLAGPDGDLKAALQKLLQAQGLRESDLVESMRNDISTGLLRQTIGDGVYVSSGMSKALYQWNMEERTISYVTIPASSIKIDAPSNEALTSFYDNIKSEYSIPESKNVTVGILDPKQLVAKTEVTEEKVKAFYDSNKSDFESLETRTLEQAVFKTEKEANDVLASAKSSKDLKAAVISVTGNSSALNADSNFDEKSLPEELSKPVFTAKIGDLVGPFKTALGYHVIMVKSKQDAGLKPYDSVKAQIKKELSETASSDALFEITNQIEDRLAEGEKLENMADEFKIRIINLNNVTAANTTSPALADYDKDQSKILQTAATTNENESSPLSEIAGGKMFTVHVNDVTPAKAKDLKDVKADVVAKWMALEKRRKLLATALEITQKMDEGKATLQIVANDYNTTPRSAKIVRGSTPPEGFSKPSITQIMDADKSKAVAIPDIENIKVVKIEKVSIPDKTPSASELTDVQKNLSLDLQEDRFVSLINYIQKNAKVVVNRDLIDRMYGEASTEQ